MAPASASPVRSSTAGGLDGQMSGSDGAIVREMDVYLSNGLADRLQLIQFPLQQAGASQMPISSARLKARHNILQIDQDMPSLPRRIYQPQEQNFSFMGTRTFQSQTIPVETHLCLGKIRQDEQTGECAMYLVPIQQISQMRPTMSHIHGDTLLSEDKGDDDDNMEEEKEKKATLKPLTYQRKESDRAAEYRKSSYIYKKKSEAEEPWEPLDVVDEESDQVEETMNKIFKEKKDFTRGGKPQLKKGGLTTRPEEDYVQSLNYMPPSSYDALAIQVSPDDPKTIVAKLTVLLRQGLPIPYALLRTQLPDEVSDQQVFDALSVCAILVRGNFCLHSRFVSLPRELQRARTFMLSLLQNNGLIRRQCLERVYEDDTRVSSDKLHVLLQLIAKRTAKGWILRVEDDIAFVVDHPDQAALHKRYWDDVFASRKQRDLLQKYNDAINEMRL
eukprot:scaffold877_cov154-Amphora_coffeaeformis.AAC.15